MTSKAPRAPRVPALNKFIHLFLWDADDNRRASDTAADSDATGIRPDLSIGSGNRREEAQAQCCNEGQMPLHDGASHSGFAAQSDLVVVPAVNAPWTGRWCGRSGQR